MANKVASSRYSVEASAGSATQHITVRVHETFKESWLGQLKRQLQRRTKSSRLIQSIKRLDEKHLSIVTTIENTLNADELNAMLSQLMCSIRAAIDTFMNGHQSPAPDNIDHQRRHQFDPSHRRNRNPRSYALTG